MITVNTFRTTRGLLKNVQISKMRLGEKKRNVVFEKLEWPREYYTLRAFLDTVGDVTFHFVEKDGQVEMVVGTCIDHVFPRQGFNVEVKHDLVEVLKEAFNTSDVSLKVHGTYYTIMGDTPPSFGQLPLKEFARDYAMRYFVH